MQIQVVKSKIHRVKCTGADLNYIGSITIDEDLLDASNIIENENVAEKVQIETPDEFINLIKCQNSKCITRNYDLPSRFVAAGKNPLRVKCHYCEKIFGREEIELL